MIHVDQLKREISLPKIPKRIISLVPSQTELLVSLGLEDCIVGVTKFCVHPRAIRDESTIVGGTKKIKYEIIEKLNPDIILCNKEENTKEIVSCLEKKYAIHVSDISSISDALDVIKQYGDIFCKKNEATELISKIQLEKKYFDDFIAKKQQRKVVYFIWKDPWMIVGKNTFIDHLLRVNGFINAYGDKARYPEVMLNELSTIEDLDLIMLSSEPFPFSEKHLEEIKDVHPRADVILVDGEFFSWHGSRLVKAFSYFKTLH